MRSICLAVPMIQLLAGMISFASAMFDNFRTVARRGRATRSLLEKSRKLDEAGDDQVQQDMNAEDMEAFLMGYTLKFMQCIPDEVLTDADYNDHYGVVIFRLCPSNTCSDNGGCSSGYADFAVDVGTYVESFIEDQQDNMNWDDQFAGEGFGQCAEYEVQNDDGNNDDGVQYYIGPGCTEDGAGVKMGVYEDKYCYQESETSFEIISNGWSLPYSDGGLVSTQCIVCTEDNGELRDMCLDLYEVSPYRCEKEFEFQHYYYDANFEIYRYGKDETGCTNIEVIQNPRARFSSGAVWEDAVIVVLLLIVAAGGFAWYSIWWRKQKENLEKIEDDDSQYHLGDDNSGCGDDMSGVSAGGISAGSVSGGGEDVNESAFSNYEKGTMT